MENDVPFDVMDEIQTGDLSDVTGNELLPAASKVLFSVKKASIGMVNLQNSKAAPSEENPCVLKKLRLELRIREGIEHQGSLKFVNKPCFVDVVVWANPEHKVTDWYKSKKHLWPWKQIVTALGYDVKSPPAINDEFLKTIMGMELRGDIKQKPVQVQVAQEDGSKKWVDTTELTNEFVGWRAA